jgi:cystathionine beta-lyase
MEPDELVSLVMERMVHQYDWEVQREWIVWLPGLETALTLVAQSVGQPESSVLYFSPIYPPFMTGPRKAKRKPEALPLLIHEQQWRVDWQGLEARLASGEVSLLSLCNPHNPTGKVFSKDELLRIGELCIKHKVTISSDEVHCDLILNHKQHHPIASLSTSFAEQSITLMAPSKTYNIAGLGCGYAIIPNAKLRQSFKLSMRSITPMVNPLSFSAAQAALKFGEPWRQALLKTLRSNLELIDSTLKGWDELSWIKPEATYLAWINCSAWNTDDPQAHLKAHRLGLSPGAHFGSPQYVRLNFACPEKTLREGLMRFSRARRAILSS